MVTMTFIIIVIIAIIFFVIIVIMVIISFVIIVIMVIISFVITLEWIPSWKNAPRFSFPNDASSVWRGKRFHFLRVIFSHSLSFNHS